MTFEILTTPRLLLRKITPEVFNHVFENYSDVEKMIFFGLDTIERLAEEQRKYDQGVSTFSKSFLYFQVMDRSTEKVIGWCGYHTWYIDHDRAEIGYGISEEYQKQGLMSEAMMTIIKYGFFEMKLHRIEAFIGPENDASLAIANKFGFQQEGLLREHYRKDGIMEDSAVFAILKREFEQNPTFSE